jgi:hypothetical protein
LETRRSRRGGGGEDDDEEEEEEEEEEEDKLEHRTIESIERAKEREHGVVNQTRLPRCLDEDIQHHIHDGKEEAVDERRVNKKYAHCRASTVNKSRVKSRSIHTFCKRQRECNVLQGLAQNVEDKNSEFHTRKQNIVGICSAISLRD